MLNDLKADLEKLKNQEKGVFLQRFFKTGPGQYGEGDVFIGISVPDQRKIAIKYRDLSLKEIEKLIKSKIHEERLIALFILILKYKKDSKTVFDFYLKHTKFVNNWDLVDSSAHKIVGEYLLDKNRSILYQLAKSENLWERRISIISNSSEICLPTSRSVQPTAF